VNSVDSREAASGDSRRFIAGYSVASDALTQQEMHPEERKDSKRRREREKDRAGNLTRTANEPNAANAQIDAGRTACLDAKRKCDDGSDNDGDLNHSRSGRDDEAWQ
jgi:hypothetical protein